MLEGLHVHPLQEALRQLDRAKACSIVRKPDGWHLHLVCERPAPPPRRDGERCALDLGVEALATLHTGERIDRQRRDQRDAPSFDERHRRARRRLRSEQRALSRRTRGSRRRRKQVRRLARAHLKLARVRRDAHHKLARALVDRYPGGIAVEDLGIANMVRSARGSVGEPGRNVKQKAGLNRAILDRGWAQFVALVAAKAEEAGSQVVYVDPRGGSQECSRCGADVPKPLSERWHRCLACGLSIHRDHNAAINYFSRAWAAPVAEAA